ncbi:MAG TPA: dicarboxylate/amino acid:cation symporter [Pseudomonadales bacterium]|nr:dicarboxylate/amino acid:cation symporter [Pseudomonadales bacterium]
MTLNTRILLGTGAGILLGLIFARLGADSAITRQGLYWLGLISSVFVGALKMVMVPLIFSSIAVGVAQLQAHHRMHSVWVTTLVFFAISMLFAIMLGITAMHWFKPAAGISLSMFSDITSQHSAAEMTMPEFFSKFVAGLFANPIAAMAQGNIMAVLVFALLTGIAMVTGGERYKHMQALLTELLNLMLQIVGWIMHLAPLGILALLAKLVATQDVALFSSLGKFMLVVTGTTIFHGAVVLPLLLWLVTRISPLTFWRGARPALLTAFATSSSAATLPVTLNCLERDMGVQRDVANFVAPLGAQVNMDGTALYEAAAALFVAGLVGMELNLGQQLVVCLTAMIAAIGAPGIPSAGMVTMIMVLQAVGLPAEAIAILLPIDRILDTVRTTVNVEGDMVGSLIVQKISGVQ